MALIHVDGGGSWWPSAGKLLKSGVYETHDPVLIEAALEDSKTFSWLTVEEAPEEAIRRRPHEATTSSTPAPGEPQVSAEPRLIEPTPPEDGTGNLTAADLSDDKPTCNICGKEAASKAGLISHRRNQHPEVDAKTGEPKPGDPAKQPAGAPNEDDLRTNAGGDSQEPGADLNLAAAAAKEQTQPHEPPPAPAAPEPEPEPTAVVKNEATDPVAAAPGE